MVKNKPFKISDVALVGSLLIASVVSIAQTISGKVLDASGSGIENALVRHSNNSSKWTKTSSNGSYSISGSTGTKLRVGALHYEMRPSVNVNATSNFNITLQKDQLEASGDEYHIGFDHTRPGEKYSLDELKEDFTIAYGKGFYDGSADSDRASIDPDESIDEGGTSLKVKYPKGKVGTSNSGVDTRVYLSRNYKTGSEYKGDDLYISYWMKFDNGVNYRCGGKLPSLGGEFYNPVEDKNQRFKGRIMWRKGGSVNMYMELPHDQPNVADNDRMMGGIVGSDGCIPKDRYTQYFNDGEWHNVELHYVMEKNGNPGYFECWIDGGIGYKYLDSKKFGKYREGWPGMQDLTSNFIMISTFYGGSDVDRDAPLKDEYIWFDEFRVSKTRINEYSKYKGGTITTIEDTKISKESIVYPNPSENGIFNLTDASDYEVLDLSGTRIKSGSGTQVDLSNEPKGMYFLKVGSNKIKLIN